MGERETSAFDELEKLLMSSDYDNHRLVVVPNGLWQRLRLDTRDPFGGTKLDDRVTIWYRGRAMVIAEHHCLNLCNSEVEPDGRED